MSDDDMDFSDDGGVLLDLNNDQNGITNSLHQLVIREHRPQQSGNSEPKGNTNVNELILRDDTTEQPCDTSLTQTLAEMDALYHQDPSKLTHPGTTLWRLPETPSAYTKFGLKDVTANYKVYHTSCHLIQKNWKCSAQDGMPEILQAPTPYSLAMLLQIRMLSSYSKSLREHAHATLMAEWSTRLVREGISYDETAYKREFISISTFGTNPNSLQHCETTIQENKYGLTLEDVAKTAEILRYDHRSSRKERKLERKPDVSEKAKAKKAPKVEKPKVEKALKKSAHKVYLPLEDISTKNTLSLDSVRLARLANKVDGVKYQDPFAGGDDLVAIEYGSVDDSATSQPGRMNEARVEDASQAKVTKPEKDVMQEIAFQLGNVRLREKRAKSARRRLRREMAGFETPGRGARSSLPSERVDEDGFH